MTRISTIIACMVFIPSFIAAMILPQPPESTLALVVGVASGVPAVIGLLGWWLP